LKKCLSNEILSLKNLQQRPHSFQTKEKPILDQSSIDFFHKRLWDDMDNENEGLSPANSPLPDKVVKKDESFMKENSFIGKVPRLDLTKAKKIQEINARKNFHQGDSGNKDLENKYIDKLKQ